MMWVVAILNVFAFIFLLFELAKSLLDTFSIGNIYVVLKVLSFPAINVIGALPVFKRYVKLVFSVLASVSNFFAILFLLLMITWPMGNFGEDANSYILIILFSISLVTEASLLANIAILIKDSF